MELPVQVIFPEDLLIAREIQASYGAQENSGDTTDGEDLHEAGTESTEKHNKTADAEVSRSISDSTEKLDWFVDICIGNGPPAFDFEKVRLESPIGVGNSSSKNLGEDNDLKSTEETTEPTSNLDSNSSKDVVVYEPLVESHVRPSKSLYPVSKMSQPTPAPQYTKQSKKSVARGKNISKLNQPPATKKGIEEEVQQKEVDNDKDDSKLSKALSPVETTTEQRMEEVIQQKEADEENDTERTKEDEGVAEHEKENDEEERGASDTPRITQRKKTGTAGKKKISELKKQRSSVEAVEECVEDETQQQEADKETAKERPKKDEGIAAHEKEKDEEERGGSVTQKNTQLKRKRAAGEENIADLKKPRSPVETIEECAEEETQPQEAEKEKGKESTKKADGIAQHAKEKDREDRVANGTMKRTNQNGKMAALGKNRRDLKSPARPVETTEDGVEVEIQPQQTRAGRNLSGPPSFPKGYLKIAKSLEERQSEKLLLHKKAISPFHIFLEEERSKYKLKGEAIPAIVMQGLKEKFDALDAKSKQIWDQKFKAAQIAKKIESVVTRETEGGRREREGIAERESSKTAASRTEGSGKRKSEASHEKERSERARDINSESCGDDDEYLPSETDDDEDMSRYRVEPREFIARPPHVTDRVKPAHGNATTGFLRYQNERLAYYRSFYATMAMTRDVKDTIKEEWRNLKPEERREYINDAKEELRRRKDAGMLPRNKRKLRVEKKRRVIQRRMSLDPEYRFWQSYMSLPSIMSFYGSLTAQQKEWMYSVGLGGLEHLQISSTSEELNKFLYTHFDPTGYFEAHGKRVEITEEMVGNFFGIRSTGEVLKPVRGSLQTQELSRVIGLNKPVNGIVDFREWFKKEENKNLLTDEWKRRAVLLVLACFGMPNTRQGVRQSLSQYVMDLEKLETVNWAKTWLEFLKEKQLPVALNQNFRGGGCLMILLMVYLDYFHPKFLKKDDVVRDLSVTPRLMVWDDEKVADRWRFVEDQDQDVLLEPPNEPSKAGLIAAEDIFALQKLVETVAGTVNKREVTQWIIEEFTDLLQPADIPAPDLVVDTPSSEEKLGVETPSSADKEDIPAKTSPSRISSLIQPEVHLAEVGLDNLETPNPIVNEDISPDKHIHSTSPSQTSSPIQTEVHSMKVGLDNLQTRDPIENEDIISDKQVPSKFSTLVQTEVHSKKVGSNITESQIATANDVSSQYNQVTYTCPSKFSMLLQNDVHSTEVGYFISTSQPPSSVLEDENQKARGRRRKQTSLKAVERQCGRVTRQRGKF